MTVSAAAPADGGVPARLAAPPFTHVIAFLDPARSGAAAAAAHAGLLAKSSGARLTLFHVSDLTSLEYDPPGSSGAGDIRSAAERLERATLESLAQTTGVPRHRRRVVVERVPLGAATLAEVARRLGADAVVMAPHRRNGLATVIGRSLTRETVERLHDGVPVLCARGEARPFRRIVVPTDFTPRSRAALRLAARLGALFGSEVTVLHAIDSGDEDGARAALDRFLPRELSALAPRLAVERGDAWAAIVNAAERTAADLVVMSTGGHDSLSDAVRGSNTERVIRHAPCPVLVS